MSALVIVNRRARRLASGSLLDELRRPRPGFEVVETHSLDDLEAAVARAAGRTIVLAGGDGTTMAGVTAAYAALSAASATTGDSLATGSRTVRVPIAIAPCGTMNTIARNLTPFRNRLRATRDLLDAIAEGRARPRATTTLAIRTGTRTRLGFIFGAGLVARFFEQYRGEGTFEAATITARVFAGSFVGAPLARRVLSATPCSIVVDGSPVGWEEVSLLCAGVVRNLGLGMRLLYRANERSTDSFHVVGTRLGPSRLGPQMPLVLAGRPLLGPRIDSLARHVSLQFPGGAKNTYVLDGELFDGDVDVSLGPAIDLIS